MSIPQVTTREPFSTLLKGKKSCSCGRRHLCSIHNFQICDDHVEAVLYNVVKKMKILSLHFVSTEDDMLKHGTGIMNFMGSLGYTVSSSIFSKESDFICDHVAAGNLILHIPGNAQAIVVIGDKPICDLAKYAALKNDLPVILIPTYASTDSFASGTADFIENNHRMNVAAKVPSAILADLSILTSAPIEKTNAGIGSVIANYVSLADWQMSVVAMGSYICPDIAETLLTLTNNVFDPLSKGYSAKSNEVMEPLISCLVASGVFIQFAGTDALVRGSESAIANYLEFKLLSEGITDYSFDLLRGLSSLYCLRMYDSLRNRVPDFNEAYNLLDNFGWVYYNSEIFRVFGEEYGNKVLARSGGDDYYNSVSHRSRIVRLRDNYDKTPKAAEDFLPTYSKVVNILKAASFPCSIADLGFTKEEITDALVWSKEDSPRYGIVRYMADIGMLEYSVDQLLKNLK